ncbi:hypothetical protein CDL12_03236 [Handroanthus impetiginosus]|uniref:Uncharacterized protein n=1 Tax=Handroanthus impetiginosus TaxID=429701 RepID=A0A2G9I370_9LAMI|nr:hypothetical protein CDL12_03236 [Handroanthus impetiginosus]
MKLNTTLFLCMKLQMLLQLLALLKYKIFLVSVLVLDDVHGHNFSTLQYLTDVSICFNNSCIFTLAITCAIKLPHTIHQIFFNQ